jgi:hypothetical protein
MTKKKAIFLGLLLLASLLILFAGLRANRQAPAPTRTAGRNRDRTVAAEASEDGSEVPRVQAFWTEVSATLARLDGIGPGGGYRPVRRNPMYRPPPPPPSVEFTSILREPEKTLTLSGVLIGEKTAFAIINGEVVRAGDNLGGVVVAEVKADRVILLAGPERREVVLEIY